MNSKKSKSKEDQSTLSVMKSVLNELEVNKSIERKVVTKKSVKDILWDYPIYLLRVFKAFVPFSYILTFLLFGFLISLFIQSEIFANILDGKSKNESYVEGSVGAISSFNPLFLTNNYVDRAVEELVFDRFVYIDKEGNPLSGIAKSWLVSENRLQYDFTINEHYYWHTGERLDVDDVIFTFETAISLKRDFGYDSVGSSLIGMKIERTGENTVRFTLPEVTPSFWEIISIAIVPKTRLENVALDQLPFDMFAKFPIGSGKYKIIRTESNAVYLEDNEFDNHSPAIRKITLKIYPDIESLEKAFRIGTLDAIAGWDRELFNFVSEYSNFKEYNLREEFRVKNIFLNMRKDSLKQKEMRISLTYLLNKEDFLSRANISGHALKGVYSENSWAFNKGIEYYSYNPKKAEEILKGVGYIKNPDTGYFESKNQEILTFTLSYFESKSNERLVNILIDLYAKEGVIIKPEKLNYNQITQEIISTRDFEMLLYEVELTVDPDQYSLWHSLKTNYPDLNLSGYAYERVDILLEDGRKSFDKNIRKSKYALFQKYLIADAPAIFLYNPTFVYFVRGNLDGIDMSDLKYSYERFHDIEKWSWN